MPNSACIQESVCVFVFSQSFAIELQAAVDYNLFHVQGSVDGP